MISKSNHAKWCYTMPGGSKLFKWLTWFSLAGVIACNRQHPQNPAVVVPAKVSPQVATKSNDLAQSDQVSKATSPPVLIDAPKFTLTDQTGAEFGSHELDGCIWIANFVFTRCMATCPRQTSQFEELQKRLSRLPDWEHIRLVTFTVDPENDTVARLHEYAESHGADHAHWKFLTGTRSDLWDVSKNGFKLPVATAPENSSSPITHSSRFILVDSKSRIRGYYDGLSDDDIHKLKLDVRSLLSESTGDETRQVHVGIPADVFDPTWLEQRQATQLATADQLAVFHDFQFKDQMEASGIRFQNHAVADAASAFKRNHYDHANGLAVADVDGDEFHDLYFVSQVGGNELWRNLGNGQFQNITESAGVGLKERVSVSASFADTDNDGDPDLFVTTTRHGNVFFENDGQGHFRDISTESGLNYTGHSSSGDFFDYDRDGRLDLFLTNVGVFTTDKVGYNGKSANRENPYFVGSHDAFIGHLFADRSERSHLYHNEGNNRFRNVSEETGLLHAKWSGDACPLDANDDGWMDLYVVNMQGNDEYYENIEGKRFELRSRDLFPKASWGGMCVKSFDYNNDGRMDLLTTNMHADMWQLPEDIIGSREKLKPPANVMPESYLQSRIPGANVLGNAFYENQGEGRFREVSDQINVENYWPWGHSVGDLNADGFQDVFITSCMNFPFRYHPNSLLLNDGGRKFVDAEFILGVEPRRNGRTATPWFELDCSGADLGHEICTGRSGRVVVWGALGSRSSVLFDIDCDGDLDIITNDFNSPPMVLISNLSERNPELSYLKIKLKGTLSNRDGLGTKVAVTAGGNTFTQVHDGQSGYLSQSALPLYFGLGKVKTVDKVVIQWPSGKRQEIEGSIQTNRQSVIIEPDK